MCGMATHFERRGEVPQYSSIFNRTSILSTAGILCRDDFCWTSLRARAINCFVAVVVVVVVVVVFFLV